LIRPEASTHAPLHSHFNKLALPFLTAGTILAGTLGLKAQNPLDRELSPRDIADIKAITQTNINVSTDGSPPAPTYYEDMGLLGDDDIISSLEIFDSHHFVRLRPNTDNMVFKIGAKDRAEIGRWESVWRLGIRSAIGNNNENGFDHANAAAYGSAALERKFGLGEKWNSRIAFGISGEAGELSEQFNARIWAAYEQMFEMAGYDRWSWKLGGGVYSRNNLPEHKGDTVTEPFAQAVLSCNEIDWRFLEHFVLRRLGLRAHHDFGTKDTSIGPVVSIAFDPEEDRLYTPEQAYTR